MGDLPEETAGDKELQQRVPWRGRDALYVVLVYFLLLGLIAIPFDGRFGPGLLLFALALLGVLTVRKARRYRSSGLLLGKRFRARPSDLMAGTVAGVIAFAIELVFAWAVVAALGSPVGDDSNDILGFPTGTTSPILLVLILVVAAPLFEELFFRGLLLQGLQKSFGNGVAVVVSGTLFGLAHFQDTLVANLISMGTGVFVGLLLGWLFVRYENLAIPIATHATLNVGALFLVVFEL